MRRGKYTNRKVRNRQFTHPEEYKQERLQEEQLRKQHASESSSVEEKDVDLAKGDKEETVHDGANASKYTDVFQAVEVKGVSNLIGVENPVKIPNNEITKIATLELAILNIQQDAAAAAPSVAEKEELEKPRAQARKVRVDDKNNDNVKIATLDLQQDATAAAPTLSKKQRLELEKQQLLKRNQRGNQANQVFDRNSKQKEAINILTLDVKGLDAIQRPLCRKDHGREYFNKLQAKGKTWQAKGDLARLAIVKKERENAKKCRESAAKEKEVAANQQKLAQTQKVLEKK